jgi:hypothetical protein
MSSTFGSAYGREDFDVPAHPNNITAAKAKRMLL